MAFVPCGNKISGTGSSLRRYKRLSSLQQSSTRVQQQSWDSITGYNATKAPLNESPRIVLNLTECNMNGDMSIENAWKLLAKSCHDTPFDSEYP